MRGSARTVVLALALAGFGAFTSVWVVIWLVRGSYPTALVILGLTIWAFGFATFFLCTSFGSMKPRIEVDGSGVLLRPAKFVDTVFIIPTVAITIVAALYLILSPLGMIDYVPSATPRFSAPVGCAALLLFGVPTLYRMLKHRGSGHLYLGPAGFEVWNAQWGSFRHGSWQDVEQILDQPIRGRRPSYGAIVFALANGRSVMLMADAFTDDSDALREWVRFYWQHPEFRNELVDDRALQRLSDENFTTG